MKRHLARHSCAVADAETILRIYHVMCGLAGFRNRNDRRAEETIVARMLERQRHRGPDHRGTWVSGDTALGLDRLAILDLSAHGDQPFTVPDCSGALAYNGEVYNWRQLREELVRDGVTFTSECDTEVVLHALRCWGPERAVPRFNGMFALAWRDLRDDTLWLARDRTGIKPLYVAEKPDAIVFASEAKALFEHPAVPCRPDIHSIITHVLVGRLAGHWTPFEGVRTVVPGTMLRIDQSGTREIVWFDVERDVEIDRIIRAASESFESKVSTLRTLLEQSVELHLQSDAPLAMMCSGGLDSSLTTAIAVRHKPNLVAYVAEVQDVQVKEADKAQRVADHLGVHLRRIPISHAEFPDLWTRAAWHNDDPIYFNLNPLALKVCEAVRDDGFKVLVTGEGSDELFGGYRWQDATARRWRLRDRHSRLLPDVSVLRRVGRLLQKAMPLDMPRLAEHPFSPMETIGHESPFAPLVIDSGMRASRARSLFALLEPITSLEERAFLAHGFDDIYHHLRVLITSNDKMSMAASVEVRVPFLETAMIDFGMHLDARAKRHNGITKRVVKAVAGGLLPPEIIHARKVGFDISPRMFGGYEGILEGGLVAEFFKWSPCDRANRQQLLRSRPTQASRLVSLELWAQLYFNGLSQVDLAERLRAVRKVA